MTTTRDQAALRRLCGVTLLSMAALMVTGCSKSAHAHTLVFDIRGQGELSTLTYVINGKETSEKSVGLPWQRTVHLPAKGGGYTWHLKTQQNNGSSQTIVFVDGRAITNGSCAGDGCNSDDSGSIRD